jgi:hypothetical protein
MIWLGWGFDLPTLRTSCGLSDLSRAALGAVPIRVGRDGRALTASLMIAQCNIDRE